MSKHLIFCADGTWNGAKEDEDGDREPDATNVYKLFLGLAGNPVGNSPRNADEQEKEYRQEGQLVQMAKYIHGVGDSRNPIHKLLSGAFGTGMIARIVRGYTFLSRNYQPGDAIVLVGFSRGAYTARALGGLIASQGLLKNPPKDKEQSYYKGSQAWYRYRKAAGAVNLAEAAVNLPAFLSSDELTDEDLIKVESIKAIAVWDTVGALGLPRYLNHARADAFRFTNNQLSPKVEHGLHAVALDEQRLDFTPSLWDPAPAGSPQQISQVLFPGAHADVGGGYPTKNGESGLSNGALWWMINQLQQPAIGVHFAPGLAGHYQPDPCGIAHQPWRQPPFNLPGTVQPRALKGLGLPWDPSIAARAQCQAVIAEPGDEAAKYVPNNH